MCHIAAVLLGIASTVVLAVPPLIAIDWFAQNERATAIGKYIFKLNAIL